MITITGNEVVSLGLSACTAVLILEVLGAKDMGRPEARDRASQLQLHLIVLTCYADRKVRLGFVDICAMMFWQSEP
jgi:hypothetical protein